MSSPYREDKERWIEQGRAEALVLQMVLKNLSTKETLAMAKAMKLPSKAVLLAADRLAKTQEIPKRPFPWAFYEGKIRSNFITKDIPGMFWCRTCGAYVPADTIKVYYRPDGSVHSKGQCSKHRNPKNKKYTNVRYKVSEGVSE